jgi:hypothetical protein
MRYLLLCAALIGLTSACASSGAHREGPPPESTARQVERFTLAAQEARQHPMAAQVQRELAQVDRWLNQVDAILASREGDRGRIPLLLEVVEAQLVRVRARFARLEADAQVEDARERYNAASQRIEQYKRQTEAINKEARP